MTFGMRQCRETNILATTASSVSSRAAMISDGGGVEATSAARKAGEDCLSISKQYCNSGAQGCQARPSAGQPGCGSRPKAGQRRLFHCMARAHRVHRKAEASCSLEGMHLRLTGERVTVAFGSHGSPQSAALSHSRLLA